MPKQVDIGNIVLFASYVCIADGVIYDNEVKVINKFLEDNNQSEEVKDKVKKIFSDSEDKPKLYEILDNLKKSGPESVRDSIIIGLNLAYSDGFFDLSEETIFNSLLDLTNFDKDIYLEIKENIFKNSESIKQKKGDFEENLLSTISKKFLKVIKEIASGKVKKAIEMEYTKLLLKGKEYNDAIEKSSDIAKIDLSVAKNTINEINDSYNELLDKIDKILDKNKKYLNSKDESEKQFYELLKNLQISLKEIILNRLEQNRKTLNKKEKALNYYTISFIGKTKAGKSTLHSVITGEGYQFIGEGQQRTTRYNRVYEWEKLRIIDTPGIGAPGGQTDEEIAQSVIEESDLICYILKNDSQQECELTFLKLIKEQNKPIVILLNIKENIENETKLNLYLKNPEKWFTRKDEKSIEGNINRIKRYAEQHYKNGFFEIYPVQLLAAKMSGETKYSKQKSILFKSSHVQDFLNSLRIQIIDEGIIKRSQTMLDGTIYMLTDSLIKLKSYEEPLIKLSNSLKLNRNEIQKELNRSYNENRNLLEKELKNVFIDLKEKKAMDFSTLYYDADKDDIKNLWDKYLEKIKFNENLSAKVKRISNDYMEEVKNSFKVIEENMNFFSKLQLENMNFTIQSTFDVKSLSKILSGVAGVAGSILLFVLGTSNPIGWVVTGLAVIGSIFSGFFKSKAEKIREATQKLYSSIKKSIEKNETNTINSILDEFENKHNLIINKSLDLLDNLQKSIIKVTKNINPQILMLENNIQHLNKIYAYRILNFMKGDYKKDIDDNIVERIEIERIYGSEFTIKSNYKFRKKDEEKVSRILQEKVKLLNNKEKA